jgi:hypothetical protein
VRGEFISCIQFGGWVKNSRSAIVGFEWKMGRRGIGKNEAVSGLFDGNKFGTRGEQEWDDVLN